MRALVTGGAGFIGSHVVDELIRQGFEVSVVDDLSGGFLENVNKKADFFQQSVLDYELMELLFQQFKPDYVYHLAAYAAEGLSHFIRRFNYQNNLIGSTNIINLCVKYGVKCLVFTSSIAVYGTQEPPMREDQVPHPEDPYGISKYAVELDLEAAHKQFGLNYIVFRPHNVYGPRQNIGDRYRNVIGIFMNNVMKEEQSVIFGDGTQERAFTYVKDIIYPLVTSVKKPLMYNKVFNLGTNSVATINRLIEIMGVRDARHEPARNEVVLAYASHNRLAHHFSIIETPLEEGIEEMWRWALKHGPRQSRKFEKIELVQNLPPSWI